MEDAAEVTNEQLALDSAGMRLRRAREKAKLSIEQIAAETRIPQRHIHTLESGDFARLPSRAYAIGFSRSYAKAVGLDAAEITDQVRGELARASDDQRGEGRKYEPGDPARVPSRGLAWLTALAAVLLLVGGFSFYRSYFAPGLGPAPLTDPAEEIAARPATATAQAAAATAAVPVGGEVVFTAIEDGVWVKFYDAAGAQLMQKEMAVGERYTVPADAEGPQVWTGRPDALRITVGGRDVPKLAEEQRIVRDVPVTASALLARNDVAANGAAPAAGQAVPGSAAGI
jgi:cytoskeleton protein RodZ